MPKKLRPPGSSGLSTQILTDLGEIRHGLLSWYRAAHRDLPWRRTRDPYAIWISEVMLQQTRVAAVIPYYERFLTRFPNIDALAAAPQQDLLIYWSGLGYYTRARNLKTAALHMQGNAFPNSYEAIRALPGIGDYTAAAVASIAFDLPHAALDGNAIRVLSRLSLEGGDARTPVVRRRLQALADALLDRDGPGSFNQAVMELGATVCLPKQPRCPQCPLSRQCRARMEGMEEKIPVRPQREKSIKENRIILIIAKGSEILMWQRPLDAPLLAGFWELPEPSHAPGAQLGSRIGVFRHSITNHDYRFEVIEATLNRKPSGFRWISLQEPHNRLLSTVVHKALTFSSQFL